MVLNMRRLIFRCLCVFHYKGNITVTSISEKHYDLPDSIHTKELENSSILRFFYEIRLTSTALFIIYYNISIGFVCNGKRFALAFHVVFSLFLLVGVSITKVFANISSLVTQNVLSCHVLQRLKIMVAFSESMWNLAREPIKLYLHFNDVYGVNVNFYTKLGSVVSAAHKVT